MRPILLSPEQGADTIVWLATAPQVSLGSSRFWHDRRARPECPLPWTRETDPAPHASEVRQHNVAEHRRHGEVGHEPVLGCLCGWLVEGVEGLPEGTGQLTRRRRGAVGPGGPAVAGPVVLPEHRSRRLGGRQPAGEVGLMRRTRDSSASEYNRKPPAERTGWRRL